MVQTLQTSRALADQASKAANAEQERARSRSTIEAAERTITTATSRRGIESALRDAQRALTDARRTGGDREARVREVRALEQRVEALRRAAESRQAIVDKEASQALVQAATRAESDRLSAWRLGVPAHLASASASDARDEQVKQFHAVSDEDVALAGVARSLPGYLYHVDRRDQAPHIAREEWQPARDPLPTHAKLHALHRVVSVARTVSGDVAFLNQDGVPVAARFALTPDQATDRDGWVQRQMQKVFTGDGLDAGHMGPLFAGGPHLVEFVTGQLPAFNRGKQGGFERAIAEASSTAVAIEVSVIVDAPLGIARPKGYWFEATAVAEDGTRRKVTDASGYYAQTSE